MTIRFVIPWYGIIPGGAERECRRTAEELAGHGLPVEVWTTTVRELGSNWNVPYHREGRDQLNGVSVRRFRADMTDHGRFIELNRRLLAGETLSPEEQNDFLANSVNSRRLCEALAAEPEGVNFVIPYCFGLSVAAARVRPERAYMIPCFHDEGYARLAVYRELFQTLRGLLLHSEAERDLIRELHDTPEDKMNVIGEGVDTDLQPDPARFRQKYGPGDRFILCIGRKDFTKNVPELVSFFGRYRERFPESPLRLVLVGTGHIDIPPALQPWVSNLAFLPRQDVVDALGAAEALVQPSRNESFSLVLMEAWVCGIPALVNGACAATREAVSKAHGGLWFDGYPLFETALRRLEGDGGLRKTLGAQGRRYVLENYSWARMVEVYSELAEYSVS